MVRYEARGARCASGLRTLDNALARKLLHPAPRDPVGHEIALVEHEDEMLLLRVLPQVRLHRAASCALDVASVEHVQNDVRAIEHLVKLAPDSARLPLGKQIVAARVVDLLHFLEVAPIP